MRTFKDSKGRDWSIDVNLGSLLALKGKLEIDLMAVLCADDRHKGWFMFLRDDEKLAKSLFVLADPKPTTDQADFQFALDAKAMEAGAQALEDGLLDFFRPASLRETLRESLKKVRELEAEMGAQATTLIQNESVQGAAKEMLTGLLKRFTDSVGGVAASSVSTPDRSRSGN